MNNKLDYGIKAPWQVNKYYCQSKVLAAILTRIHELGMVYYVCQSGEPTVRYGGEWMGYKEVSMLDKRLVVEGLYD